MNGIIICLPTQASTVRSDNEEIVDFEEELAVVGGIPTAVRAQPFPASPVPRFFAIAELSWWTGKVSLRA
jgi:hypothetical protein